MDFGLARQMDVESRVTQSGMAVGTPAYMSPEQIRGSLDEVGATADIYALGVILYELLTGQLPFRGPIAKVVYSVVHEEPVAPSQIRGGIDPELESICAKMMAKERGERFPSMDDVAAALNAQRKAPKSDTSSAQTSSVSSLESNTAQLTETDALNAFFAVQAEENPAGTMIESAPISQPARKTTTPQKKSAAGFRGSDRNRKLLIASGFAGGSLLLLLGIIIYFPGGKVELDDDSDAVVHVDEAGNLTIKPGSAESKQEVGSRPTVTSPSVATSLAPSDPNRERSPISIDLQPEVLDEWPHADADFSNCYLATLAPNGDRLAFRIGDGPLQISETAPKRNVKVPSEMQDAVSIAFSADGRLIATGHENKKIRLWDADSLAPVGEPFESPIEPKVAWVYLSADGTTLIAMANDREVKLKGMSTFLTWEISTRKLISRFQAEMADQNFASSIDASADGRVVAVISVRDGASLWETNTGKRRPVVFDIPDIITSRKRVTGMDLSADGSRLAYGVFNGAPSYAAILDTSTGKERWNSGRQNGRVHTVQFSADGKWLASTAGRTNAHQLSLWDANTGAELERWTYPYDSNSEHADRVKFLSFSDDGSRLMLAGPYMPVVVWRIKPSLPANSKTGSVEGSDSRTESRTDNSSDADGVRSAEALLSFASDRNVGHGGTDLYEAQRLLFDRFPLDGQGTDGQGPCDESPNRRNRSEVRPRITA